MTHTVDIRCGDALTELQKMPEESVACCVTSPPYFGLRNYGVEGQLGLEKTPEEYVSRLVDVFREVRRVLRDDGTAWIVLGDSYSGSGKGGNPGDSPHIKQKTNVGSLSVRNQKRDSFKPKDLIGVPWLIAFALRADGWWLRSEITWCLSHSTRVYAKTQKGEMPMTVGEMVRLKPESVSLWTGNKWARVEAFKKSNASEGVEIRLRSGQRISSTAEHLWPTERGEVRTDELRIGDRLLSVRLPQPAKPQTPEGVPDRFGWVAGFYLAEGSRSSIDKESIRFSMNTQEKERTARIEEFAAFYGGTVSVRDYGNSRQTTITGPACAVLRSLIWGEGAQRKHLTTLCWQRSDEFLAELLQGYLDGDAHWDSEATRFCLGFCRNDILTDDLRTLCARLGYSLRLKRQWHSCQSGKFYGWKGDLRMNPYRRKTCDTEIMGLQFSKSESFWDINIEAPHVFALSSGILTHNCKRVPMPESVTDRPTSATEKIFLLSKSAKYFYNSEAVRNPPSESFANDPRWKTGSTPDNEKNGYESSGAQNPKKIHRVFDKQRGHSRRHAGFNDRWDAMEKKQQMANGSNMRNWWLLGPEPYPEAHFATFPTEIPKRCILAGSRPGDTVLDPFVGSGTTGLVALELGRGCIGIELSPEYCKLARRRCHVTPGLHLA